jgi:glycosyltransferase involved in cell wall biosynthesis
MTALGIKEKHWDAAVSCEYYDGDEERFFGKRLEAAGIKVSKLEKNLSNPLMHMCTSIPGLDINDIPDLERSILTYIQALLESRPQVVHAWMDQVNILAGLAALIVGVPKIILSQRSVAPHNFLLYRPEMRPGYKALMESPRVTLLNNSHGGAQNYARWLGITPDRITVIHNGFVADNSSDAVTDTGEFRSRFNIPPDAPLMGVVFRFYEEKRPLFWLEIAGEVLNRMPHCYFILIGDGHLLDRAKRFAEDLELSSRVRFTGVLDNVMQALKAMDVFVLSSRVEGLSNVLIEAQLAGVPVVAPDVGGVAETIAEGRTGFAVVNATVKKMADRVVEVMQNRDFRESVRKWGPEFVHGKFGLEKMIDSTETVYEAGPV